MNNLEIRNQKIIDAVTEKAKRVCPESLALIGINGSFMTGDFYEKSDLDLLILINDEKGWQLGCAFIQDDLQVGHDIYCTTWERLQEDARYDHPNISKLMDAKIVYCSMEAYREQLEQLRKQAREILSAPFSMEDYEKAEKQQREAEHFYAMARTAETLSEARNGAGGVIYFVENAVAMLNKQYFRYGVKRAYDELNAMEYRPTHLCEQIDTILAADSVETVQQGLTALMKETAAVFRRRKESIPSRKEPATAERLAGTCEEMVSNWRNKMYLAAETGNRHLSFMSLFQANAMLDEIGCETEIGQYDALGAYAQDDLNRTAVAYDELLEAYAKEYQKAGIPVKHYSDIDTFVQDYLK